MDKFYLVLLVQMHALGKQVSYDVLVALPSTPIDGAVSAVVNHAQIAAFRGQHLEYVKLSEAGGHVNSPLSVPVRLVDVNIGHGEQLVQALAVVFLDSTEYCREHEIIILKERPEMSIKVFLLAHDMYAF